MDERNPHMHLCFVPLTKDKRLSAKEVMGDRNKLIEWQDKFHEHMAQEFSELERGESAAITKRKHIPTWLYKQANRLTEQMEQMKREIEGIGTFNAQKKDSPLFADFLKDWLKTTAPTIERTTYQSYENMINPRLDSFFRMLGVTLAQVEPSHIRALHDSIFKDGCNANTVIHYHAVVRKALQYAVKNELISKNPADMVDRPKLSKYTADYYNEEEMAALFEATKHDSIAVVIRLAAYYGLRRSEVLGIRWSAIDFQRGTISINHKVTEGKAGGKKVLYAEDKLKTKSSFRTLPLIPKVRTLLQEVKDRQEYHRKLFKKSYDNTYSDYVCVDEMGKIFNLNYITDHFGLLLKRYQFRIIRFHDLRHSCASLLLAQGIPMKSIQEWLGHPDMLTTKQAMELTGYNDTTANNWAADGKIQAINYYGKNLISKESLAKYLSSPEGQRIARPSQAHREMFEAFADREQKSGMAFGAMSL
jgi:integrase